MYIDIKDVAFWMDAVRNSENHYGVLESFWKGQLRSKEWLIDKLRDKLPLHATDLNVVILGGWNGVLASMLYNSNLPIKHIVSVDIDESCKDTALMINKRQEIKSRFTAVTADMCEYEYSDQTDIFINTSTEHLTTDQYDNWIKKVPDSKLVVLQNNNYRDLPEHVNCYDTEDDFANHCGLRKILYVGSLDLPLYDRFLVIGYK